MFPQVQGSKVLRKNKGILKCLDPIRRVRLLRASQGRITAKYSKFRENSNQRIRPKRHFLKL